MPRTTLDWDLQYAILALWTAAKVLETVDLDRADDVSIPELEQVEHDLRGCLRFFRALFPARGEEVPAAPEGMSYASLGPRMLRSVPKTLCRSLASELEMAGEVQSCEELDSYHALGLHGQTISVLRFLGWLLPRLREFQRTVAGPADGSAGAEVAEPTIEEVGEAEEVEEPPPQPPGPDLSAYEIRIDEAGERLVQGTYSLWFASSRGPEKSRKPENQDAAFAELFPGGVSFAVADGVETSLGSRLAATFLTRSFCWHAADGAASTAPVSQVVRDAVASAQRHLDALLDAVLAAHDLSPAFQLVRGALPVENARRLLLNTKLPDPRLRHVGAAFAASLVAGVLRSRPGGRGDEICIVRAGSGTAELKTASGVLDLFPGPMRPGPPHPVAPGPSGADAVAAATLSGVVTMGSGDALLLGTQGLLRGHDLKAWSKVQEVVPGFERAFGARDDALRLLRALVRKADSLDPPIRRPFDDNLALVLLTRR